MIDVKDLRIGTLALLNGEVVLINGVTKYSDYTAVDCHDLDGNNICTEPSCLDGIELLPEHLKSAGFDKKGSSYHHPEAKFDVFDIDGTYYFDMNAPVLEYVHQLQNVLVSNRGYELNVVL